MMKIKVFGFYKGQFTSGTYLFVDRDDMQALQELRRNFVGFMHKVRE